MKKIIIWVVIILVLIGAVYGLAKLGAKNTNSNQTGAALQVPVSDSDYKQGPTDAKAVLVEYADFQCPACGYFYPIIKQAQQDFNGQLLFVYRFFPLNSIHANADLAARAAVAAGNQGKFWEMHDVLFEKQNDWASQSGVDAQKTFEGYAQTLGLNLSQFKKDLDAPETEQIVSNGLSQGSQDNITSTPSIYLNGKKIQPQNYDELKKDINDVIK